MSRTPFFGPRGNATIVSWYLFDNGPAWRRCFYGRSLAKSPYNGVAGMLPGSCPTPEKMPAIQHPILGQLDPSIRGFWRKEVVFAERPIQFDLTIDRAGPLPPVLSGLPQKAEDLAPYDRAARLAIQRDAESGDEDSAANLYVTHHESELSAAQLQRLFDTDRPSAANRAAMLSRLLLVRVGLYPEENRAHVVLDYSIDPDFTHYLLCVSFDAAGQATAVDLES
jgi:hypothetical protein